jgi:hypothetical protein
MSAAIEKELLDLEQKYWRAIRDKDADAALRLTDDPCIVAGASGAAGISRAAFAKMLYSPAWTLREFEIREPQIRLIKDDVAVVAYKVKEELDVEGKPLTLEAADSSTWIRRDGHWLCAVHTESILGDPFGRDRRPAG